jgi:hypothetical protein
MNKQNYVAPQVLIHQKITFETIPSHVCEKPKPGEHNPHC